MTKRSMAESGEGETGGMWRKDALACGSCGGVVVHDVIDKIGRVRESWRIEQAPSHATTRGTLHCPACDALLVSARPPDGLPAPVVSFDAARPGLAERETEHACTGCGTRYVLREQVEATWRRAGDGDSVPSPRPYPRSR